MTDLLVSSTRMATALFDAGITLVQHQHYVEGSDRPVFWFQYGLGEVSKVRKIIDARGADGLPHRVVLYRREYAEEEDLS